MNASKPHQTHEGVRDIHVVMGQGGGVIVASIYLLSIRSLDYERGRLKSMQFLVEMPS
jgi:hypothetical protein